MEIRIICMSLVLINGLFGAMLDAAPLQPRFYITPTKDSLISDLNHLGRILVQHPERDHKESVQGVLESVKKWMSCLGQNARIAKQLSKLKSFIVAIESCNQSTNQRDEIVKAIPSIISIIQEVGSL